MRPPAAATIIHPPRHRHLHRGGIALIGLAAILAGIVDTVAAAVDHHGSELSAVTTAGMESRDRLRRRSNPTSADTGHMLIVDFERSGEVDSHRLHWI